MRTICSICLDEVGKEPLVTLVNCGHVFDLKCIRECLKTSLNCPICRKGIHNMLKSQLCRIFLSTEGDSSSSECLKLKTDLEENAIVIQKLKERLTNSKNQTVKVLRNYELLKKAYGNSAEKLKTTKKELTDAKSAYLEEAKKSSTYVEQIMDLTLAKKNDANEIDDLKKKNDTMARELQSQRDKCAAMAKNRNYKKEYFDLKKLFDDTLAKQNITNSKSIEIAISGTSSPDTVRYHIQGLEKQLSKSKAKGDKLFADVKRLAKKKADIYQDRHKLYIENQKLNNDKKRLIRENQQLRENPSATNEGASGLKEHKLKDAAESKSLQKQLKTAREDVYKLQEYKQNWIVENHTLRQNLKTSQEKIKILQATLNSITAEKNTIQEKLNEISKKNQVSQDSTGSRSATNWSTTASGEDMIILR